MRNILAVAGVVLRCWSRRKEGYILVLILAAVLYAVASMHVLSTGGPSLYLYDVGLLLTWFLGWIVAIHVGAGELPGEESRGTVFLLLAKPLSRAELIAGKWLGAWTTVVVCALAFHVITLLAALAVGVQPPVLALLEMCLLHLVSLAVLTAMALAVSTRSRHSTEWLGRNPTTSKALVLVSKARMVSESAVRVKVLSCLISPLGLQLALPSRSMQPSDQALSCMRIMEPLTRIAMLRFPWNRLAT